jgi:hypothetical protein
MLTIFEGFENAFQQPANPRMQPTNAGDPGLTACIPASARRQWTMGYHGTFAADAHFVRQHGGVPPLTRTRWVLERGEILEEADAFRLHRRV